MGACRGGRATNPPAFAGFPTNQLLLFRTLAAACVPPESEPLMNLVRRTKARRHGGQQCAKSHCPVPCHSNTAQPLRECPGDNFAGHAASCVPAENRRDTWSLQKVPAEAGPRPERAEGAQSLQRPSCRVELSMSLMTSPTREVLPEWVVRSGCRHMLTFGGQVGLGPATGFRVSMAQFPASSWR